MRRGGTTYNIWRSMVARCTNPSRKDWSRYGGAGIGVCDRWLSFENFLVDMGERPDGLTIDRIDNAKGYSPENCRWASWVEQASNRRSNRLISFAGKTMTVAAAARELGISRQGMRYRIENGWEANELVMSINRGNAWKRGSRKHV